MLSLKTSPRLLIASLVVLFLLISVYYGLSTVRETTIKNTLPPNYRSITSNRQKLDITSEVGRASNATLGVCFSLFSSFFFDSF